MRKQFGHVALECAFDLGITVVYAVVVGILIVAVVASDDGPISVLRAGLYATILPAGALALIFCEIGLRLHKEWRASHHARTFRLGRFAGTGPRTSGV